MKRLLLAVILLFTVLSCDENHPSRERGIMIENKNFTPFAVNHNLSGPLGAGDIPVRLVMDQDETITTLTVGEGSNLVVLNSQGERIIIAGSDIEAEYYHLVRLLVISVEENGRTQLYYFTDPVSWNTEN